MGAHGAPAQHSRWLAAAAIPAAPRVPAGAGAVGERFFWHVLQPAGRRSSASAIPATSVDRVEANDRVATLLSRRFRQRRGERLTAVVLRRAHVLLRRDAGRRSASAARRSTSLALRLRRRAAGVDVALRLQTEQGKLFGDVDRRTAVDRDAQGDGRRETTSSRAGPAIRPGDQRRAEARHLPADHRPRAARPAQPDVGGCARHRRAAGD